MSIRSVSISAVEPSGGNAAMLSHLKRSIGASSVFVSNGNAYPLSLIAAEAASLGLRVVRGSLGDDALSARSALACDLVVLSLRGGADTFSEALAVCGGLESLLVAGARVVPRGIICLSSLRAWEGSASVDEAAWRARAPPCTNNFIAAAATAAAELRLLSLPTKCAGGPAVHILAAGLVYGAGESALAGVAAAARKAIDETAPRFFRAFQENFLPEKPQAPSSSSPPMIPIGPIIGPPPSLAAKLIPCIHAHDYARAVRALLVELRGASWPTAPGHGAPLPASPYGRMPPYAVLVDAGDPPAAGALAVALARVWGDGRIVPATPAAASRAASAAASCDSPTDDVLGDAEALAGLCGLARVPPLAQNTGALARRLLLTGGGRGEDGTSARPPATANTNLAGELNLGARTPRVSFAGPAAARTHAAAALARALAVPLISVKSALEALLDETASPHALCDGSVEALDALAALRAEVKLALDASAEAAAKAKDAAAAVAAAALAATSPPAKGKAAAAAKPVPATVAKGGAPAPLTNETPPPDAAKSAVRPGGGGLASLLPSALVSFAVSSLLPCAAHAGTCSTAHRGR